MNSTVKTVLVYALMVAGLVCLWQFVGKPLANPHETATSMTELLNDANQGKVAEITVNSGSSATSSKVTGKYKDGNKFNTTIPVFYPDLYNGAFAACPDPITFSAYTTIDLYKDKNAYAMQGANRSIERVAYRNYLGEVFASQRDVNYYELALGDKSRSGEQYDIWQAVFGPRGADGYPQPIFDKVTGEIDPKVAAYWRDNYDLVHIVQRDWATLGPKLAGKLNIYVGRGDNYFLTNAVYAAQPVLEGLRNPAYGGEIAYGDKDEHCWNGDPTQPNAIGRLRYNTFYLPRILKRIEATAPAGADLTSWRY